MGERPLTGDRLQQPIFPGLAIRTDEVKRRWRTVWQTTADAIDLRLAAVSSAMIVPESMIPTRSQSWSASSM